MSEIKLCYHPKTEEVRANEYSHASVINSGGKAYDKWVRAIVFPELKRIYFRFYTPSGDYTNITEEDRQYAYTICEAALRKFISDGLVKKSWKVLFWTTDAKVDSTRVRY